MNSLCPAANFALIDGLLRPGALASLYQRGEGLDIEPLYLGTRWKDLHHKGPILVGLQGNSSLADEILDNALHQADASLLYSSAPIRLVADHLRRFVAPENVQGGKGLLRFADPLVAHHWLGSYQGAHLDAVLGPIETWHVPESLHTWTPQVPPRWSAFTRSAPPAGWADTHALLGLAQLEALQRASRWRFMERLYHDLEERHPRQLAVLDHQQLTQWFDERFDEAQAWGLSSRRGLAIWVEYSLRWGQGFTLRADSPYRQWQARTPLTPGMAPEQRILQMDDDCLDIELNQEAA